MLLKQVDYVLNMFFYLCISEIDLGLLWTLFMLFLQLIYNEWQDLEEKKKKGETLSTMKRSQV